MVGVLYIPQHIGFRNNDEMPTFKGNVSGYSQNHGY